MRKRLGFVALLAVGSWMAAALPAAATGQAGAEVGAWEWTLLPALLGFLVPIGLLFVAIAGMPSEQVPRAGLVAMLSGGLGVLSYWAAGFALQFGGIGLALGGAAYRDLSWEWSLLDVQWGPGWGMAGLRGFFLTHGASTPEGLTLFLSHLPWVLVVCMLPALALASHKRAGLAYVVAFLTGGFLYPLFGNWVWGGGWLANLGHTRLLGHGFVDYGGSGGPFLLAGALGLAVLVLRRKADKESPALRGQMPVLAQPAVAIVGVFLMLAGLAGWVGAAPQAQAAGDAVPRALVVVTSSSLAGMLTAGFYTWFVARRADVFMVGRGAVAGAVAALAGAPFVPLWVGWIVGALAGLLLPLAIYLVDRGLKLADEAALVATLGVPGFIGAFVPAILADGAYGAGWNGIGGAGVAGLIAPATAGWEGQLYAQAIGVGVALVWGFVIPWAVGSGAYALLGALVPSRPGAGDRGNAGS
ncbi:MAG: hypothetical protein ACPL7R_03800 [Anaerolineae bacterium]